MQPRSYLLLIGPQVLPVLTYTGVQIPHDAFDFRPLLSVA